MWTLEPWTNSGLWRNRQSLEEGAQWLCSLPTLPHDEQIPRCIWVGNRDHGDTASGTMPHKIRHQPNGMIIHHKFEGFGEAMRLANELCSKLPEFSAKL